MSGFACESFEVLDDEDRVLGTMVEWTEGYPLLEWIKEKLTVNGILFGGILIVWGLFLGQSLIKLGAFSIGLAIAGIVIIGDIAWRSQRLYFGYDGSMVLARARRLRRHKEITLAFGVGDVMNIERLQVCRTDDPMHDLAFGVELIMRRGEAIRVAYKISNSQARILVARLTEAHSLAKVAPIPAPADQVRDRLIA